MSSKTTRRALLGAIAVAVPAIASGAVPQNASIDTAAWDKAYAALVAAIEALPAFEATEWAAARRRWHDAGKPQTGEVHAAFMACDDRSDALAEHIASAESALMKTPAPHADALMWKLEHIMEDTGDGSFAGWSLSYTAQMTADVRRLLNMEA